MIQITDNISIAEWELTETFTAWLTTPTQFGTRLWDVSDTGTGTISDNDTATWSLTGSSSVVEGANATYTVGLSGTLEATEVAQINLGLAGVTTSSASRLACT